MEFNQSATSNTSSQSSQNSSSSDDSAQDFQPSLPIKLMCGYMYFIQGVISSIPGTVPYIYPHLPDYLILSVFSFANMPYSLKFLVAPLLEKYFDDQYGKRKTWIFISQISTSLLLLISSFFTQQSSSLTMAWFAVALNTAMSLQDISLDGLAIKQMKSRSRMSTYQTVLQNVGIVLGGLGLLKLTSLEFAKSIGLTAPITSLRLVFIVIAIFLLIPTILIHFLFEQTFLEEQLLPKKSSILKVYLAYRCYFYLSYRYFRQGLFLLIYYQGINFFVAGYNYQLINHGFSRNTMNDIDNINQIPQTILAFLLGTYANHLHFTKTIIIYFSLLLLNFLYLFIWFPISTVPIVITSFFIGFLANWDFIESSILAANFPRSPMTSMLYTFGASCNNAGKLNFIQVALLKIFPWRVWAAVGMVYMCLIMLITPWAMKKIKQGETDVTEFLEQDSEQEQNFSQFQRRY